MSDRTAFRVPNYVERSDLFQSTPFTTDRTGSRVELVPQPVNKLSDTLPGISKGILPAGSLDFVAPHDSSFDEQVESVGHRFIGYAEPLCKVMARPISGRVVQQVY